MHLSVRLPKVAPVQTVENIIMPLPADGQAQVLQLAARYQSVRPPTLEHRATMWFRMRLLTNVGSMTAWLGMKGYADELSRVVAN